jgi:hypothetical protein
VTSSNTLHRRCKTVCNLHRKVSTNIAIHLILLAAHKQEANNVSRIVAYSTLSWLPIQAAMMIYGYTRDKTEQERNIRGGR